ncbi:MAG: L,D-transpeptidase family protein [Kiritimatiellales bacterium]|nr:L,D-transpeptidase family protein [Kiritimatiellota bacterium]MBL7011553.1 L,D-transpeptidase family protein [Kiritimatiellales bacterium]
MLPVLLIAAVVGGVVWWLLERPESIEEPAPAAAEASAQPSSSVASKTPSTAVAQASAVDVQRMYNRAQSELAAGKLVEASALLDEVIEKTTDPALKNNALRVQGRINVQLFLSAVPTPEKKSYVIQPGDSLDRIARRNNTTVELIRTMNGIKGDLIYPGARLLLPAVPFEVLVDKSARQLDLMMNGKLFKRYSIGVGQYGKTPVGTFHTVVHQENPDWTPPSGGIIPFGDPRNVLGTRWMSFEDKDRPDLKGFGIHGTSQRDSIGGETSNGCIRMLNEDVEEVFLLIPRGTQVVIQE